MSYDQKIMDRVIQDAIKNPIISRGRTSISRMAAWITDGSEIFEGWNTYKTHPMMYKWSEDHDKICLHAEIAALIQALREYSWLYNFDCYIARVLKDNTPALARPCETCLGALTYYEIRNIWWTE
jgi:tRNA(Arg) A34 adenosine deaminase TadA